MLNNDILTRAEADQFRTAIPQIIQATYRNEPVDGSVRISVIGMGAEGAKRLCYPLTPELVNRIHRCTNVRVQTANIVCQTDLFSECKGVLTFYAAYHFVGTEPSGETLSIQEQGWLFVHCHMQKKRMYIDAMEGYPLDVPLPDKVPTVPADLPPSPRKARKRLQERTGDDELKSCCWEGVIELISELLFD